MGKNSDHVTPATLYDFQEAGMRNLLLVIVAIFCNSIEAQNWNRFRGPSEWTIRCTQLALCVERRNI